MKNFTDLIAWQKSHKLIIQIYQISANFPKSELFGLTNQIRRAAVSVAANLAEGCGRYHQNDKRRFYLQARGSNTEVQNFLILAKDLNFIDLEIYNNLQKAIFENFKIICGLINKT